ncbi:Sapep family Mn(2+)-dependent dipeptidase [Cuneatibacter caecimuris]|uniref:Succinyl-diaminopimelate desuccinylase n=1 Tax=Cuneatibacter caecimuris TaxID=1796618 RepID=A0A4Q7P384_9FIRM|nr:Sapep family Mn(2+)-dependent dipeptidase [Cuneatibacter caecimuris]RZS94264.1 succinyl-diaminopimelate desuccinylase [Cuneatibacter caecimuris]
MNDKELSAAVAQWARDHREEMVQDLISIVNRKSISEPGEGGFAFGTDCKDCADAMAEMGRKYGFDIENDDYYTLSVLAPGGSKKEKEIGILGHLDVVPEGTGWRFEPYQAVEKDGFVIGRGSSDNKGAVIMSLYVMRCMRDLGVSLDHTLRLICGFNEEAGMQDVEHYLKVREAPEFTIVCDGGWAMIIGEKGLLTANLNQKVSTGNLIAMEGGVASNSVPDTAWAKLVDADRESVAKLAAEHPDDVQVIREGSAVMIVARGIAAHAAFPEGSDSAIGKLNRLLTEYDLVTGDGAEAVRNLAEIFTDNYGTGLGIDFTDDISGRTTCVGGMISLKDGVLSQNINVRYAIRQKSEELLENLKEVCEGRGIVIEDLEYSAPRYTDPDAPVIKMLLDTCHEFLGEEYEPYTMGGGTHARKFPNALPYGPGGIKAENPFGHPHGADEAVHIDSLIRSMSVYAVALVRLDTML